METVLNLMIGWVEKHEAKNRLYNYFLDNGRMGGETFWLEEIMEKSFWEIQTPKKYMI